MDKGQSAITDQRINIEYYSFHDLLLFIYVKYSVLKSKKKV